MATRIVNLQANSTRPFSRQENNIGYVIYNTRLSVIPGRSNRLTPCLKFIDFGILFAFRALQQFIIVQLDRRDDGVGIVALGEQVVSLIPDNFERKKLLQKMLYTVIPLAANEFSLYIGF